MTGIKGAGGTQGAGSWIQKIRGSAAEARERFLHDQLQREAAGRGADSVILDPREVHGEYDVARLLVTTLGGESRAITADDLAAFRRNIKTVGYKFKGGGIKARQVLDLSLRIDLERAREQIKYAVPAGFSRGMLRLITNAGGETPGVTRHHLQVTFPLFDVAVNDSSKSPKQAAAWLVKQPLKYDCDCGRHRFWYRYIATIGGFNAGRPETGYPKIRNPGLHGVGCKHALRAMSEIESSAAIKNLLERAITAARDENVKRKDVQVSQKEAEDLLKKASREIKTSADRKKTNDKAKEKRAAKKAQQQAEQTPPIAAATAPSKAERLAAYIAELGLSEAEINAALSIARGKK